MKKIISLLVLTFTVPIFAQDFAPSGVYVTSGFSDSAINSRILICDYSADLQDTYCRVIENGARAAALNSGEVFVNGNANLELGVLTGRTYGAALGTPKSSGEIHQVQLTKSNVSFKTKYSLGWTKIDSNADIKIPVIEKSTRVRLNVQGKVFEAVGGTYQY